MPENIIKRLRDTSQRMLDLHLPVTGHLMQEAADEIEYLRQRCEQIDNEWRQREADLQAGVRSRKDGWG